MLRDRPSAPVATSTNLPQFNVAATQGMLFESVCGNEPRSHASLWS